MANFQFADEHIEYLRAQPIFSMCKDDFWAWLAECDCSRVRVTALREGTFCLLGRWKTGVNQGSPRTSGTEQREQAWLYLSS